MPELPDLVHVERVLGERLIGRRVTAARTGDPTVLRLMIPGDFAAALVGQVVRSVERRGHFMRFGFDGELVLVVNAMLVGKYRLLSPDEARATKDPTALGFALVFDDEDRGRVGEPSQGSPTGSELRYLDDKRMGKVYVARPADEAQVPVYNELGVDLLSPAFDRARFEQIAKGRRDQVRPFLMDKRALASIGNAYADEILFAARIHPKTFVRSLSEQDRDRLFGAINQVLRAAIDEIERRDAPADVKVRDFLSVRGRVGKPCPSCGTKIREVRVNDWDACFCPTCQPVTRSLFIDWSRIGPPPEGATAGAAPAAAGKARPRRRTRRAGPG